MTQSLITWLNDIGGLWLRHQVSVAWQFAALVAIAALVTITWRRAPASFKSALWIVALMRLLLPAEIVLPTGVGTWSQHVVPPQITHVVTPPENWIPITPPQELSPVTVAAVPRSAAESQPVAIEPVDVAPVPAAFTSEPTATPTPPTNAMPTSIRLSVPGSILAVWIFGVIAMTGIIALRLVRLRRIVNHASRELPPNLVTSISRVAQTLDLKRPIDVRLSDQVATLFVAGLWRPVVVLPRAAVHELASDQIQAVLLHEFAHVRRRDCLLNWLQITLEVLHFFNPLVWIASRQARLERELACDALVMTHHPEKTGETYTDAMLTIIRFGVNSFSHVNFMSDHGVPVIPVGVTFSTASGE